MTELLGLLVVVAIIAGVVAIAGRSHKARELERVNPLKSAEARAEAEAAARAAQIAAGVRHGHNRIAGFFE